jgi:hypothetical protein
MNLNLLTPQLRIGIEPCGCIHELGVRYRVIRMWRCPVHDDRYVKVEALWPWRRCESCRRRRARYRMTFSDSVSFLFCFGCEPVRWR